jgi:hypothetical protein
LVVFLASALCAVKMWAGMGRAESAKKVSRSLLSRHTRGSVRACFVQALCRTYWARFVSEAQLASGHIRAVRRARERSIVFAGDLFDQIDDAAAELRLLDARERLGERQAFGCRQEV